jgi:hypothetical protein
MPLAPLEWPFRAFPSRGGVAALAGLVLPCGFAFDRPTARHGPRDSRPLSPARRPLAAACPKARRTGRPGRRFPGVARRRTSRVAALVCGVSSRIGRAHRTRRPARPLRSFAPLESPFSRRPKPWPGHGRPVGALLSLSPLELAPRDPRVRSARGRTWSGRTRAAHVLESSAPGHAFRQVHAPTVGPRTHDPTTRRVDRTLRVTVRQRPCSQALSRSAHTPVASPARVAWEACAPSARPDETCCPRPLSAAPRASRVLRARFATRAGAAGPRRRSISVSWWAGLLRGRPALVGFCPSSNRLVSASLRRRAA